MGVRRLFSRGSQKIFKGGGQEPTFCIKNNEKNTIFGLPGGQEPPPLALFLGRPC